MLDESTEKSVTEEVIVYAPLPKVRFLAVAPMQ